MVEWRVIKGALSIMWIIAIISYLIVGTVLFLRECAQPFDRRKLMLTSNPRTAFFIYQFVWPLPLLFDLINAWAATYMSYSDRQGCLYSEDGLRFGGYPTSHFLQRTQILDLAVPFARWRIIAEAHYLILWQEAFVDLAFLATVLLTGSVALALAACLVAYTLELVRFYLHGASRILSRLSRAWHLVRLPIFVAAAVALYSQHWELAAAIGAYWIGQAWIGLVTNLVGYPIRIAMMSLVRPFLGRWCLPEFLSIKWVTDNWLREAGIDPRSIVLTDSPNLSDGPSSK